MATAAAAAAPVEKVVYRPVRRKLPDERRSITHKFSIGGHEGYITVGMYDDGAPGEIFITMAKEGSTISGLMDAFATAVSFNLQYGVPLQVPGGQVRARAFRAERLDGQSADPVREVDHGLHLPLAGREVPRSGICRDAKRARRLTLRPTEAGSAAGAAVRAAMATDAPLCAECGSIMTRNGSCYKCGNCGGTSGCS